MLLLVLQNVSTASGSSALKGENDRNDTSPLHFASESDTVKAFQTFSSASFSSAFLPMLDQLDVARVIHAKSSP